MKNKENDSMIYLKDQQKMEEEFNKSYLNHHSINR